MGISAFVTWCHAYRRPAWGARGNAFGLLKLPTVCIDVLALRRRKQGLYDFMTLRLFKSAWHCRPSPGRLVNYLSFRRDLGFLLPHHRVHLLLDALPRLNGAKRRKAFALLAEFGALNAVEVGGGQRFQQGDNSSYKVLEELALGEDRLLVQLNYQQVSWRKEFCRWLTSNQLSGICVSGNGAVMRGARLGQVVDENGVVVRFNCFRSPESNLRDIGTKTDVWVVAPDYSGQPPDDVDWIVVSGPDVRFHKQHWESLQQPLGEGTPVLTVPLEIWRQLVAVLCAPPSAGILFLAWLQQMLGSWEGVTAVGFGGPSGNLQYHHALPKHRAGKRHNWTGERALMQQWEQEGLTVLVPRDRKSRGESN